MTLTTALALAGCAVLLALALHGWWLSRRAGPKRASAAASPLSARVEPAFAGDPLPIDLGTPGARHTGARRVPRIDALIDAIVPLTLDVQVSGEAIAAHLPPSRRA